MKFPFCKSKRESNTEATEEAFENPLNGIKYDSLKTKMAIEKWLNLKGWTLDDFSKILKELNLFEDEISISSISACDFAIQLKETKVGMTLNSKGVGPYPTLTVSTLTCKSTYYLKTNNESLSYPALSLTKKVLKDVDRELVCYYSDFHTKNYSLTMGPFLLQIEIFRDFSDDTAKKIENYLMHLHLDKCANDVSIICVKLQDMLSHEKKYFHDASISLSITCSKTISKKFVSSLMTSKMTLSTKGRLVEYASSPNEGELYHIFENGNWEWTCLIGNTKFSYSYNKSSNSYNYSIEGHQIFTINFVTSFSNINQIEDFIKGKQENLGKKFS